MTEEVLVCDLQFPDEVLIKDIDILDGLDTHFMNRDEAENDPSHKQIITYCILHFGKLIHMYRRKAKSGDVRLRKKYSIGVGGHINPVDKRDTLFGTIEAACRRELAEEAKCDLLKLNPLFVLYDGTDNVGRVHLGVVYEAEVSRFCSVEEADTKMWLPKNILAKFVDQFSDDVENWTKIVITKLPDFK